MKFPQKGMRIPPQTLAARRKAKLWVRVVLIGGLWFPKKPFETIGKTCFSFRRQGGRRNGSASQPDILQRPYFMGYEWNMNGI